MTNNWNTVNANNIICKEDAEMQASAVEYQEIDSKWAASRIHRAVNVGIYQGDRYGIKGYISPIKFTIDSLEKLEQIALNQGLIIIDDGEYDFDGIYEKHYKFEKINHKGEENV